MSRTKKTSSREQSSSCERILLRPREAAQVLSTSVSRMYELISQGIVPSVQLGGTLRVPIDDLRELVRRLAAERKPRRPGPK